MSNLNPQQFTEQQLPGAIGGMPPRRWADPEPEQAHAEVPGQQSMFMPLSTIVNDVYKGAAHGRGSPRQQWADPPRTMVARLKHGKQTLKDQSLDDPDGGMARTVDQGNVKPLLITHGTGLPDVLSDGHKRLAHLQARGHTEVPVNHQYLDDF